MDGCLVTSFVCDEGKEESKFQMRTSATTGAPFQFAVLATSGMRLVRCAMRPANYVTCVSLRSSVRRSPLGRTDLEDAELQEAGASIGEIRVVVERTRWVRLAQPRARSAASRHLKFRELGPVHERSKKTGTHRIA